MQLMTRFLTYRDGEKSATYVPLTLMQRIVRLLTTLVRAMNALGAVAAVLMTAFVFLSAVMRYLAGSPLRFSDELVGLLFMSMAFLAIPLGQLQRRHICVDIVIHRLSDKFRKLAELLSSLILIAFAIVFIIESYEFTAFSQLLDSRSDIGQLLLWPWMAIMPLCIAVLVLVALAQLCDGIRVLLGRPALLPRQDGEDASGGHVS